MLLEMISVNNFTRANVEQILKLGRSEFHYELSNIPDAIKVPAYYHLLATFLEDIRRGVFLDGDKNKGDYIYRYTSRTMVEVAEAIHNLPYLLAESDMVGADRIWAFRNENNALEYMTEVFFRGLRKEGRIRGTN